MTAPASPAYPPPPSRTQINIGLISSLIAMILSVATVVFAAGVHSQQIAQLEDATQPLRDGDLVRVQTDVAWIRRHLEERDQ